MKAKHIMLVLGMTMILTFTGCGSSKPVVEVTPTPAATPTPTEVPVTVTPVPTSTPAPKVIGVKTSQAKYIYMTNGLQDDLREIYLMTSGGAAIFFYLSNKILNSRCLCILKDSIKTDHSTLPDFRSEEHTSELQSRI